MSRLRPASFVAFALALSMSSVYGASQKRHKRTRNLPDIESTELEQVSVQEEVNIFANVRIPRAFGR